MWLNTFLSFLIMLLLCVMSLDYHGLSSPGLTCYLNSVLQVFFMTEDFREAVKRFATPSFFRLSAYLKQLVTSSSHCATDAAAKIRQPLTRSSKNCLLLYRKRWLKRITSPKNWGSRTVRYLRYF